MLEVNDRIKPSEYALRGAREYWLQQGEPSRKSQAKQWYEDKKAKRGTITKVYNNGFADSYDILWDDGSISSCLTNMVVKAE